MKLIIDMALVSFAAWKVNALMSSLSWALFSASSCIRLFIFLLFSVLRISSILCI